MSWTQPITPKQLRGFLRLFCYCRKFIQSYGLINRPLISFLKNDNFHCSEEAENVFPALKSSLTLAFVLTLPNYAILFVVKIDASDSGIDAVLLQSGHPAAFISKTDIALPLAKLSLDLLKQVEGPSSPERRKRTYVVLVSTGSFNPPTYMHLRCFELARDALTSEGFCVIGGYMLPVNDAYKKKSLISAEHRVAMCQLACKSSELVMKDPWESGTNKITFILSRFCLKLFVLASQDSYQRTLTVLSRIKTAVGDGSLASTGSIR
ncbi:putative protein isoform X1 [Capsicum galapagoense]